MSNKSDAGIYWQDSRISKLTERMNSDRCDLTRKIEALEMRVNKLEHANQQEQCDHVWAGWYTTEFDPPEDVRCVHCGKKLPMYDEVKVGDLHNVIMISGLPLEEHSKWELAQIIKRLSEQLENIWNQ